MKKTIPAILGFLLLAAPAAVQGAAGQGQSPQSVTLAWNPSVGATDVAGYFIYYGGTTGNYTNRIDVGLATSGVVSNLLGGATYYFATTVYTSSGLESEYSSEVMWQCPQLSPLSAALQAQYPCSTNAGNTLTVIGYTGPGGSVTIPSSINNLLVTTIGCAFAGCTNLTSVTIPGTVISLDDFAFAVCARLTNVTVPGSVTSIGDYAFAECPSLTSVYFAGNAPAVDSTVFLFDNNVTAYYLPGTTGWDVFSAESGLPVVLWNPLIQTGDGSFGVQNNQFGFNITGATNIPIMVEACTDLTSPVWTPLQTLTLTNGSFYFSDPQWTNYPGRYYRISPL